jgi:hypothetical protein
MVVVKIQGGIGNQLFQWAFGKNLSLKHNKELFVDINFYNHQGEVKRFFNLDKFGIDCNYSDTMDPRNIFFKNPHEVIFDTNKYISHNLSNDKNYYFDGYWQSRLFFQENEKEVLKHFNFSSNKLQIISNNLKFDENLIVSLHIRRTDYTKSNGLYPVQSLDYYQSAIESIGHYDKILIFSDDLDWCVQNLKFKNMIFSEGLTDLEDLMLMSKCTHNIIANSSFGWWGAYLNKNENKKVIAPNIWYGPKMNIETKDLIPESWIKI